MWIMARSVVENIDKLLVRVCTHVRACITEYGSSLKESLNRLYVRLQDNPSSEHITLEIPVVSVLS